MLYQVQRTARPGNPVCAGYRDRYNAEVAAVKLARMMGDTYDVVSTDDTGAETWWLAATGKDDGSVVVSALRGSEIVHRTFSRAELR